MPRTATLPMDALTKETIRKYYYILIHLLLLNIQVLLIQLLKYLKDVENPLLAPKNLPEIWTSLKPMPSKTSNQIDEKSGTKLDHITSYKGNVANTDNVVKCSNLTTQTILNTSRKTQLVIVSVDLFEFF